jgi:hypothetical protein
LLDEQLKVLTTASKMKNEEGEGEGERGEEVTANGSP